MRIKANFIVLFVMGALSGFMLLAYLRAPVNEAAIPSRTGGEVGGVAPAGSPADAVPDIELSTLEYDIGEVPNHKVMTGEIQIFNRGKAPLIINDIQTQCPCTQGAVANKTIPPGGTERMVVIINPDLIPGFESTKSLTVFSNDMDEPVVTVKVTASVKPELALEPTRVDFGEIEKGQTKTTELHLRQIDGKEPFELMDVTTLGSPPGLAAAFELLPEAQWATPGWPEYMIKVSVTPAAPAGHYKGFVNLLTSIDRLKSMKVAVEGDVTSFYTLSSTQALRFPPSPPGRKDAAAVTIKAEKPVSISNMAITGEDLIAEARPGESPATSTIYIQIAEAAKPGVKRETLTFTVSSEGENPVNESVSVLGVVQTAPPSP